MTREQARLLLKDKSFEVLIAACEDAPEDDALMYLLEVKKALKAARLLTRKIAKGGKIRIYV